MHPGIHPFSSSFVAAASGPEMPLINTLCGRHRDQNLSPYVLDLRIDTFRLLGGIESDGSVDGHVLCFDWHEDPLAGAADPVRATAAKILVQVDAIFDYLCDHIDDEIDEKHQHEMIEAADGAIAGLTEPELYDRCWPDDLQIADWIADGTISAQDLAEM